MASEASSEREACSDAVAAVMDTEPCELAVSGHVVTATAYVGCAEVRVRSGRIVAIDRRVGEVAAHDRLDVGDSLVLPGAVDTHVHCLSAPSEGISASTRGAAAGGVTTICDMPFDADGPIWTMGRLREKQERVRAEAVVDTALYATLQPGTYGAAAGELAAAGAAAFKLSTFDTDPDRFPRTPDEQLPETFSAIARTGRRVAVHTEHDEMIRARIAALSTEGADLHSHGRSRPPITETAAVAVLLELARGTGVSLHIAHLTTARSFELVVRARAEGLDVTAETCPHYLWLTDEDLAANGPRLKINPPLRSAADVEALWGLLASGAVDGVVSDHAPWPAAEKDQPDIFAAKSGAPGVEVLVPLVLDGARARGLDLSSAVAVLSAGPAAAYGLVQKGDIAVGRDADLAVVDVDAPWVVDGATQQSHAGWSPYDGQTLRSRVTATIQRGRMIYRDQKVLAHPGDGRLLAPALELAKGRPT